VDALALSSRVHFIPVAAWEPSGRLPDFSEENPLGKRIVGRGTNKSAPLSGVRSDEDLFNSTPDRRLGD